MKGLLRAALSLVLVIAIASPAAGGCCDDFWSCAGAIATGGLSCAAQAALAALQALIQQTISARDAMTQKYEAQLQATLDELTVQIAQIKEEIQRLDQQIDKAVADGEKISHADQDSIRASLASVSASARLGPTPTHTPSKSGATLKTAEKVGAASPSASSTLAGSGPQNLTGLSTPAGTASSTFAGMSAAALQALQSDPSIAYLQQRLDDLKKHKDALVDQIRHKEADAMALEMNAATATADQARAAYAAQILKPINDVLAWLQAALANPLSAGSVVTSAMALLGDAAQGVENLARRFVGALEQAGNASLSAAQPQVDELQKVAAEAQSVLAEMQKMTALRTALERQALARNLPSPASTPSSLRRLKSSAPLADRARTLGAGLAALKPQFQKFEKTRGAVDVGPFRPQLARQFDGYFRGKAPADARKTLADLILEARRRYASDPKTLAAVEKLLNDEARARGVPL